MGRILARYVPCAHLKLVDAWGEVKLGRTENNRPTCAFLGSSAGVLVNYDFNISHHGRWVAMGYCTTRDSIGVDVMTYEEPKRGRDVFFEAMRGCFTRREWAQIGDSLERFYRFWALKESYLKATGVGLGFNLQRLSFELAPGETRATLELDGVSVTVHGEWSFEVWDLDDVGEEEEERERGIGACVAVGICRGGNAAERLLPLPTCELRRMDASRLLEALEYEAGKQC